MLLLSCTQPAQSAPANSSSSALRARVTSTQGQSQSFLLAQQPLQQPDTLKPWPQADTAARSCDMTAERPPVLRAGVTSTQSLFSGQRPPIAAPTTRHALKIHSHTAACSSGVSLAWPACRCDKHAEPAQWAASPNSRTSNQTCSKAFKQTQQLAAVKLFARCLTSSLCRCDKHTEPVQWAASPNSRTSRRPAGCPECGRLRASLSSSLRGRRKGAPCL